MRANLMDHINKVELRGRVGLVRFNEFNGTKVANFSMVTELFYKNRDGSVLADTTWHNIVAWEGKDISGLERLDKGTSVHLTGRLRTTKYTTAEGIDKHYHEVLASRLRILTEEEAESI